MPWFQATRTRQGPMPDRYLQGVHPLTGCSPHVGPIHLRQSGLAAGSEAAATGLRARAFGLGGLALDGRCGRHCDCTIGDPMAEASPAADTSNTSAYRAANSTPADVAVLPVPRSGTKAASIGFRRKDGKARTWARDRVKDFRNPRSTSPQAEAADTCQRGKEPAWGRLQSQLPIFFTWTELPRSRSSVAVEPGDTSPAGRAEA